MSDPAHGTPHDHGEYACLYCGYVYDEAAGDPENGIPPGTRWEDLPEDWSCPMCSADKDGFEKA